MRVLPNRKHVLGYTCEGEGTSMVMLRRARECLGVCLLVGCSLLVPGTGSVGDEVSEEELADGVECSLRESTTFQTKIVLGFCPTSKQQ